jgi:hypothetical protein
MTDTNLSTTLPNAGKANPANPPLPAQATTAPERARRKRVPMSVPVRCLEVPEIPGYHLHWIKESNIPRAIAAYYQFVDDNEVPVNHRNPGTDSSVSGSTDLGARISINAGLGANGQTERLFLMKLAEEYWLEDRAAIDNRNSQIMTQIFRGEKILDPEDHPVDAKTEATRYVDLERTHEKRPLFSRPRKKV